MGVWAFQTQLDLLVKSGFAQVDEASTQFWTKRNAAEGTDYNLPMYKWTTKGQYACWRFRHTTPMSWAEAISTDKERHCIGCGCDTARKRVWVKWAGTKRTVCMACAGAYEAGEIHPDTATAQEKWGLCEKCGKPSKTISNVGTERWPRFECGTCRHREERRINTKEMHGRGRRGY